jgi:uncharacterized membrane protein
MTLLVLGMALWWGAHLFKRVLPEQRAAMGNAGKGIAAVLILGSVVLMVIGYRAAPVVALWYPPGWLVGVNNLLMVLAFYLYAASGAKTWITRKIRHPQLTAVKVWALGHLLVNGDLASVILFGGLLAWAVISVIVLNRAVPVWVRPEPVPAKKEITAVVATVVVVIVVMLIHNWLGVSPWGMGE